MKIDARLSFDKIRFDQETDAHLVLTLTAPKIDAAAVRPKLALIICVDTSSSMMGQKMEYARLSILKMIDHLKPDDQLGLVTFSNQATVVSGLTKLDGSQKDALRKLVGSLYATGSTNFAGGMLKSIDLLKDADLPSSYIQRVIMFTDGQANVGPVHDHAGLINLFKANAPENISTSAFGYGRGTDFDPDFLSAFAREGRGNYAHVEDPDKALKAFGTELGGLISTYATDIRIHVGALAGHTIEQVVSDVDASEDASGDTTITVPDLLAEESRNIVLAVKFAKQKAAGPRAVNVFEVKMGFDDFDATGKKSTQTGEAKAKVQFVKDGDHQTTPHADLDSIVGLAQLVRAQLEAEEQIKKGDFKTAGAIMNTQLLSFQDRGRDNLAAAAADISGRMDSHASYAENGAYLRSFAGGATRGVGVSSYSGGSEQVLQNLGVSLSNSHQTTTADSFSIGSNPPVVPPVVPLVAPLQVAPVVANYGWHGLVTTLGGPLALGGHPLGVPPALGQVSLGGPGSIGAAEAVDFLASLQNAQPVAPAPVPENETNSPSKKGPAKKRVKQTRSKQNW